MLTFLRLALLAVLCVFLQVPSFAEDAKRGNSDLAAADQLWQAGKFAESEAGYRALLKSDPKLVPAQAGLVRSLLRQQKLDDASDTVAAALAAQPNSAALLAAQGDVQFRLAQMTEAEKSYVAARQIDPKELHCYLGLMRLYASQSLYRQAYEELLGAHQIDPDDPEVQRAWLTTLPRRERLAAMEAYLAGPHPDDEEQTKWTTEAVAFLKETVDKPVHACKLVSKVDKTETKLDLLHTAGGMRSGIALSTVINDRSAHLVLDTGAGGIIVSRKIAERSGLTRISTAHYGGVGDKGLQIGYTAVANRIQIGELSFQDCVVAVVDKFPEPNTDGLIGTDVFARYLVEIDLPGMRLALSPLPKRPEDTSAPTSLNSVAEESVNPEQREASEAAQDSAAKTPHTLRLPDDRYIAPEMAKWTKVFRFGHTLLVPTNVNDSGAMLFGLDTGAFDNVLSVRAGHEVAKVKSRFGTQVNGMSGKVKNVYHAKVTLGFGHLQQSNLDIVTVDLSNVSRRFGTEISGFLGFAMLEMLDIKLDYRDGLVDMVFDPKRVQQLLKR